MLMPKVFLEQATQVNAWDRVLHENGEKVGCGWIKNIYVPQKKLNSIILLPFFTKIKIVGEFLASTASTWIELNKFNY